MLNKITPDNYETIRDKIIAVGITSPGTLQGLIDQVRLLLPILCGASFAPSCYFLDFGGCFLSLDLLLVCVS